MGYPMPEVEWFKDQLSIMKNPDYKTTFSEGVCCLTIEETFTEDSALFTCKAYNASGRAETQANLVVKGGPMGHCFVGGEAWFLNWA